MPVDTLVDLRQWAGELAYRLGSLSHFVAAARELLDIIHHLSSEILLRHSRKIVTLVEISQATLTRAGLKLHLLTSRSSALQNYKTLYFDILRALRGRRELISNSDNLKDRVSRLLMPLSTGLVIHQGDSPPVTSFPPSVAVSSDRDVPSSSPPEAAQAPRRTVRRPSVGDPAPAPEELMPPPSSLPHRFRQPPSITPRGWGSLQADYNPSSGSIRMARTRSPRPLHCADSEPPAELSEVVPPVIAQRRTQRFGIFCTAANGSVPKSLLPALMQRGVLGAPRKGI
ncbi:hypothetical protein BJV78DRAFT_1354930 [Lactifluus subvellereus]|nr:hypothetical protein BJV78DRAFT_1354930 [Lactifluus subvellereus]